MLNDIGVVVELGFTALQCILAIWSAVCSDHAVSSVNVSTYHKSIKSLRRNISFSNVFFIHDKIIPVSAQQELLKAASSCFANAEPYMLSS